MVNAVALILSWLAATASFSTRPFAARARAPSARTPPIVARKKNQEWARAAPADKAIAAGSVLCASPGSFDHYFMESLVLLVEHDQNIGTKGVLLNHETPWSIADMVGDPDSPVVQTFGENPMFLGGDAGRDTMLMLHDLPLLDGARPLNEEAFDPDRPKLLSVGGVSAAADLVADGQLRASQFKFFYKTVEWLPGQLEQQFGEGLFEHIELAPSLLLGQSGQKMMWAEVRQLMRDAERERQLKEGGGAAPIEEVPTITDLPATRYAPAANSKTFEALKQKEAQKAAPSPASAPAPAAVAAEPDENTVVDVLGYRVFKGNAQWEVRWGGASELTTWETRQVIEAAGGEELAKRADAMRQ